MIKKLGTPLVSKNALSLTNDNKCTGVDFMLHSGFCEYEEEKLRFPACCRQKNAIFYLIFTEPRLHHKSPPLYVTKLRVHLKHLKIV